MVSQGIWPLNQLVRPFQAQVLTTQTGSTAEQSALTRHLTTDPVVGAVEVPASVAEAATEADPTAVVVVAAATVVVTTPTPAAVVATEEDEVVTSSSREDTTPLRVRINELVRYS